MSPGQVIRKAQGRRGYDLGRAAVNRLARVEIPMTPLNFELWFRAEEYPESPLAAELARLEAEHVPVTEQVSAGLAADFLPEHRLAKAARESGEQLAVQLEAANQALAGAQTSQRRFGNNLAAGVAALEEAHEAGAVRQVVGRLAAATLQAKADADGLGRRLAAATAEIGRLREHMEVIRRDALTDGLTGLPNRKAFDHALAQACAERQPFCVALIDIDHFKRFNDTWGHATGDQVLKFVAAMIGRTGHSPRLAARYGGEEFAMLLPGETAARAALALNEMRTRIRDRVLTRRTTGEQLGSVCVSIGLAERTGEAAADLVARADEALYASKHGGRDRLTIALPLDAPELAQAS